MLLGLSLWDKQVHSIMNTGTVSLIVFHTNSILSELRHYIVLKSVAI